MKGGIVAFIILLFITACDSPEIDDIKPVIDLSGEEVFPLNCDTLYFGESFTWKVRFSDNVELGSFSLEIHHNFDQHAHSTEVSECELDGEKTPENPYHTILDFEIPAGSTEFLVSQEISLPGSNMDGEFDLGDYHFFIRLTDREGWSDQKGLNIKIINRP